LWREGFSSPHAKAVIRMAFWRRTRRQMQAATEQVAVAPSSSPPRIAKPRAGMMRQYDLVERVRSYNPDTNEDLLNRAYVYAMKAHGAQTRASGDPYFSHPLEVAAILTALKLDDATIVAALLHDTIEDTGWSWSRARPSKPKTCANCCWLLPTTSACC
jgi:guanosine-3',5'-bis(diphosphate) 3'-pyrophosphohydrolase